MTRRPITLAACVLLTACGATPDETAADGPPVPAEAADQPPVGATPAPSADETTAPGLELAGEYRIAGVDEGDINLPHGISASIGADRIYVVSQCVEMAWSYRLEGTALQTTRLPIVSCDRGRYPEEEAVEAAFTAAREVERTENNGIRFSGGGRSVILFTQ